jgi:hypothetical protein
MSSLRKAINDINLYVDPPLTVRKVANALDGGGGVPITSVRAILQKLAIIKARHLIFTPNLPSNMILGHPFPPDMPPVNWPSGYGYEGCGALQRTQINEAWVFAHYYMWRAVQVMQYLERNPSHRRWLWEFGYNSRYGSLNTGDKNYSGYKNYSPRGWFGSYDESRFRRIREVIEKVWNDRFQSEENEMTIQCKDDIYDKDFHRCYLDPPISGIHFPFTTVAFCYSWFQIAPEVRAQKLIHELFHWLLIPGTGMYVSDTHDYYDSEGTYKGAVPLYGDLAALIANEGLYQYAYKHNYNITTMTNDNYAYFIYVLGSSIYNGLTPMGQPMNQFPSLTFKW